jgi:signal peptidase I
VTLPLVDVDAPAPELDESEQRAPRRAWSAVLFTLCAPGLGHLYAGYPARAGVVWLLTTVSGFAGVAIALALPAKVQLVVLILQSVGIAVIVLVDAASMARRQSPDYALRWYNRWYVYVCIPLVSLFVVVPVLIRPAHTYVGEAYTLPSAAMAPTLLAGDYILSTPIRGAVARGDIVVYRRQAGTFAKRVVAIPGDTVGMRDGILHVNGLRVDERYARRDSADPTYDEFSWQERYLQKGAGGDTYRPSLHNWGPLIVPAAQYFFLGDNRNNSLDSRFLGFVSAGSIIARPTSVYFSRDRESGAIRWSRIGQAADR